MIPDFLGRSRLSEGELSALWEQIKERWPVAYGILTGSAVSKMDREEAVRWDVPIHQIIGQNYLNLARIPGSLLRV